VKNDLAILEYQAATALRIDWFGGDSGYTATQDQQFAKFMQFGVQAMAKAYGVHVGRSVPLGMIIAVPRNRRIWVQQ
jgi:hypothetical protein